MKSPGQPVGAPHDAVQVRVRTGTGGVWLLVTFLIAASVFYLATSLMDPTRVGDGDEYYAMQLAWSVDNRPYMREASWEAYQQFYESSAVHRVAADRTGLANKFPDLTVAGTGDFNHFWFYPMLAAALDVVAGGPDAGLSVHGSFMVLHAILFALAFVLSWRWHGAAGVAAALLLILGSPALWSMDKVHTEFFTVCLGVIAVAAAMKQRWPAASLALALASTQNISFALPAFAAGCLALWSFWRGRRWPGMPDAVLLMLSAASVLLHPLYYHARYGVVTPQLLAGGASIEDNSPLRGLLFVFDLDLGLLPNWPAGLAILLLATTLLLKFRPKPDWRLLLFLAVYLLANLLAHGGTTNLNSGASVQVSRYGLWYVALFFPVVAWAYKAVARRIVPRPAVYSVATLMVASVIANFIQYDPSKKADYSSSSWSSRFVYSRFPGLIRPHPEIFRERHSGRGELRPFPRPAVVMGPGCRMLLLVRGGAGEPRVFGHNLCNIHVPSLLALLEDKGAWSGTKENDDYLVLSKDEIDSMFGSYTRGSVLSASSRAGDLDGSLVSGWSVPEPWGVWSDGEHVAIEFSVRENASSTDRSQDLEISLLMSGFLPQGHPRREVGIRVNGLGYPDLVLGPGDGPDVRYRLWLPGERLRAAGGRVRIDLHVRNPVSPRQAGISSDDRQLGIGLLEIALE